jgi:uncharacterized protein (DUF1778 family)
MSVSQAIPLTGRFSARVAERDERTIRLGAELRHTNVSEYIINAAKTQAEIDLADRTTFVVSEEKMKEFYEALDRPVEEKPELKRLFAEKTIFD